MHAAYGVMEQSYDIQYKRHGREQPRGSGAFAEVRPCTHMGTHTLRAVKTIEKSDWYGTARSHVMDEIAMLRAVSGKHPYIIKFIEYYEEWSTMNLIFEYCTGGALQEAIDGRALPTGEGYCARLVYQLIDALAFLRQEDIVHRDVKPANVLLAAPKGRHAADLSEVDVRLADFGVACLCKDKEPITDVEGTPAFFSPEMLQLPRGKGYSFPTDMWATGVTLYMTLFEGAHPFQERGGVSKQLLRSGDFDVGWLTSTKATDLLSWLLLPHPEQRIRPEEALEHPWFASHRLGGGGFAKEKPAKLILDGHGNWLRGF